MKFNYQQMVETFGLTYSYNSFSDSAIIEEEFKTHLSHKFNAEDTLEKAMTKLKEEINESSAKETKRLEGMKQQFRDLPLLEKLSWQWKNNKLNFDSTSEKRKEDLAQRTKDKLNNIEIIKIDQSKEYLINTPQLIKEGDTLYVVVTDQNALEIGVYQAIASHVNYFQRSEGLIDLHARLLVVDNGKEQEFNFSSDINEFKSNHSYHHIFTDKNKAIEFHNQNISQKLKNMEQKIINLNKPSLTK